MKNLSSRLIYPKGTRGNKLLLLVLVFCLSAFSVTAQKTVEKLKKKQREVQKKIENTKALIGKKVNEGQLTIAELAILNQQIAHRDELINNYAQQVNRISSEIVNNQNDIIKLQGDLQMLKKQYIELVRYAYRHRNTYHRLLFVFASESFNQAYVRIKYLKQFADYRKKQALRIRQKQQHLNAKIAELKNNKNEKQGLIGQQQQEKQNYLSDKSRQQEVLAKLKTEEKRLKEELRQQEEIKEKLAQQIKRAIEEEIRKEREREKERMAKKRNNNKTPGKNNSASPKKEVHYNINTPDVEPESAEFEKNRGRLPWPVEKGEITSHFGRNTHPTLPGVFTNNNGIDIGTSREASVRCVFNGKVSSVFVIPNAGKCVIVSHGAYRTVYANLAQVSVVKGQEIKTKQQIGTLLPDGNNNTLSQAHFEIWKVSASDMEKQNPALWLYK